MLFAPDGTVTSSSKSHLVPFGEVAPFVSILPWLSNLAPSPAMTAGTPLPLVMKNRDVSMGALICFESCFREPSRTLSQRSRALFVLTNDEWFGGSEAPSQHRAMSQIRAVENRRWVAQSANGGYTFILDSHGRVVAQSRFGNSQAIVVEMRLSTP
jgi:apolipoprotein N-acyltransferase